MASKQKAIELSEPVTPLTVGAGGVIPSNERTEGGTWGTLWEPRSSARNPEIWPPAGLSPSVQSLSLSLLPTQTAAWRKQIFQQLTERTKRELENFRHYEQAVEQVGAHSRQRVGAETTYRYWT